MNMTQLLRRITGRDERAAVLVEAAIATPIVLLLFMSVAWGGLLFRSNLTTEHAAKVGARTGSVSAGASDADYQILQAIKANTAALGGGQLRKVVVYSASGFDQGPTPSCLTGGQTNVCNYYTNADLALGSGSFGGGGTNPDRFYSPSSRASSRSAPKYIGVYVESVPGVPNLGLPTPSVIKNFQVLKVEATSY